MGTFPWGAPGALQAYLGASLDGLANNTLDLGAEIDNSANRHTHMDVELVLSAVDVSAQAAPAVDVYRLDTLQSDGTNYPTAADGSSTDATHPSADNILTTLGVRKGAGSEAKAAVATMLPIPPCRFKLALRNGLGVAFGANSNTLKYRTYTLASAA